VAVSTPFDAQGCLTAEAFARIAAAPPGRAPAELAAHLASCVRCQRRLLAAAASPSGVPAPRRERPPVWRTAVAVLACVLLVIVALLMLRFLAAAPR
jgi:hypothetical protein